MSTARCPPERRDEVEASLIAEPAQAARIETWRRQNEIIRAAFAKVASEPLPLSHTLALAHPPATRPEPAPRRAAAPHAAEEPIRDVHRVGVSRSEQNSRIAGVAVAAFAAGALVTMVAAELSGMASGLLSEPSASLVRRRCSPATPPLDCRQARRLARHRGLSHLCPGHHPPGRDRGFAGSRF